MRCSYRLFVRFRQPSGGGNGLVFRHPVLAVHNGDDEWDFARLGEGDSIVLAILSLYHDLNIVVDTIPSSDVELCEVGVVVNRTFGVVHLVSIILGTLGPRAVANLDGDIERTTEGTYESLKSSPPW